MRSVIKLDTLREVKEVIIDPNGKLNKKVLRNALIIFVALCAVVGIGAFAIKMIYDRIVIKEDKKALASIPVYDRNETEAEGDLNQNIAIFGVDKDGSRTDVIFVVNFNTQTDAIKVIAVPRDTKVAWTEYQQNKMAELGKGYHEYSKITEMSAYGGLDNLRYFTVNTLEDIMGIRIDHYVVVNIDAFRKIVDAVGGVEVDVPRRMKYTDNWQDLHIDLQPGLQTLNGEQAEGLVRWRHNEDYSEQYAEGDVGRIETQQLFLKALAHKVINESTPADLLKMATAVYSDLKTDIKLGEVKDYLKYVSQFKAENITFATLPGEAVRQDKWYYILDQAEVDAFMQKIIYNRDVPIIREDVTTTTGKSATSVEESNSSDWTPKQEEEIYPEYEQEDTDDRVIELPLPEESPVVSETPTEENTETPEKPVQTPEIENNTTPEGNVNSVPTEVIPPTETVPPVEQPIVQPSTPVVEPTTPVIESPASSNTFTDTTIQTTDGIEQPIS